MTSDNARQIADWNGPSGARWRDNQVRFDLMLEPFGEAALKAAQAKPGECVLDVGCGAGETTFTLARMAAPNGRVIGADISEPLLARAKDRARGEGGAIEFRLADVSQTDFGAGLFDLVFSRFGVMFFDDPVRAFSRLRVAMKPGGRLAFACWRSASENDWVKLPLDAARHIVSPPVEDPEAPGPFSFGDRVRVERILSAAGFKEISITSFSAPILFGMGGNKMAAIDDAVAQSFQIGPYARLLANAPEETRARVAKAVRGVFAERASNDGVVIDGAAWIVMARAP